MIEVCLIQSIVRFTLMSGPSESYLKIPLTINLLLSAYVLQEIFDDSLISDILLRMRLMVYKTLFTEG